MEMNATEYLYGGLQIFKNPEEAEHALTGCTTKTSWFFNHRVITLVAYKLERQ